MRLIDVSIILPSFNGSRYIRQAIESCISQSYQNIELIIVNDCSTDDTLSIANQYASSDNRVKVVSNPTNFKLPKSLNVGFAQSSGKYLTWISDDNYFSPHAISELVKHLESEEADICYSSYYFVDENGKKLDVFRASVEELIFKCSPGACFLYKRSVHELLNGYDENKFRMEDFDFWLRAAGAKQKFIAFDQPSLYYYRKHQENLTSQIFTEKNKYIQYRNDHFHTFGSFFNDCLHGNLSEQEINLHLELYFNDIEQLSDTGYSIADHLIRYMQYLRKLNALDWKSIHFDPNKITEILSGKSDQLVQLTINSLVVQNKMLKKENPKMAAVFGKPVSWYYQEYEVLPSWYKKLGHILKILSGNRPLKKKAPK